MQAHAAFIQYIERGGGGLGNNEPHRGPWTEDNMIYVYKGASNRTSYNHKMPGAYRTKDERPYATNTFGEMAGSYGMKLDPVALFNSAYRGGKRK
jgi:hypothetical protein